MDSQRGIFAFCNADDFAFGGPGGHSYTKQWRPILGYEGLYVISDYGDVVSREAATLINSKRL